jgi:hypothetical protein
MSFEEKLNYIRLTELISKKTIKDILIKYTNNMIVKYSNPPLER